SRLPFQIFLTAFQQMRSDLFRFLSDLTRRHGSRRSRDGRAATGVGSKPVGRSVRIAFLHGHISRGDAQLFRDNLRISSLMALSLALGSHAAHSLASRMNANLATVEHLDTGDIEGMSRSCANNFDEA